MSNSSYQPVDEKLKNELFKNLCSHKMAVKIFLNKKIIESTTVEVTSNSKIFVSHIQEPTDTRFSNSPEVECHFMVNHDMYFFKGHPTYADNALIFNLPSVVYKIQRRENFRVYIPSNLLQNIEIVGEKNSKVTFNNLSLTGGQIIIKNPDVHLSSDRYKLNDTFKLKINLLDFRNQIIHCVVKFVDTSPKTGIAICGIQFQNIDAAKLQDLQNIISKIDRINRQTAA